ncbi:TetR/AcrR family transcriptional regulator [Streptomyces sp. P9(2023)]|uniref:TetR/AcrR family transcriptional regulator n=1 Tax=Streptomyces sp. P9(2023) TaxID=3064394 RepID=UPI0028F444F9|nr:TetR/AcrR family transcriptional regulator [Streptomyces sp. P9(2023)]MDT9686961.1 TetR/AcrR family transcriptional regulator [Streptomyces sp. P9(2023)]
MTAAAPDTPNSADVPGSPAWWAARRVTPAATRRGRPALDTAQIIATALRLVDEHGVQAFSLRMLADTLGSGTATLYRHFASKDEILAHVVDRVLGEPDLTDLATLATWQETLTVTGQRLYDALRRHPHIVGPLMTQVPVGPNGVDQRERALHALLAHGLPAGLAARAFTAIGHYVIGFTAQQHGPAAASPAAGPQLAAFYRGLDPNVYPAIAQTARTLTSIPLADEFRFGLDLLVGGLERHAPSNAQT